MSSQHCSIRVDAVPVDELVDPPLGEVQRPDHRLHVPVGVAFGVRTFEIRILKIASTSLVRLVDLDGREADALLEHVLVSPKAAGTIPPTSVMCAMFAVYARISPSRKYGLMTTNSGR